MEQNLEKASELVFQRSVRIVILPVQRHAPQTDVVPHASYQSTKEEILKQKILNQPTKGDPHHFADFDEVAWKVVGEEIDAVDSVPRGPRMTRTRTLERGETVALCLRMYVSVAKRISDALHGQQEFRAHQEHG